MIFLWLGILALIAGWREVEILIQRGSYDPKAFWNVYWNWKPQIFNIKVKIDSFHFANGLFVLVLANLVHLSYSKLTISLFSGEILNYLVTIVTYWLYYMYIRNLMMHIILPKKPRWFFAVPILGGILDDLFN